MEMAETRHRPHGAAAALCEGQKAFAGPAARLHRADRTGLDGRSGRREITLRGGAEPGNMTRAGNGTAPAPRKGAGAVRRGPGQRAERLTAEMTAFREARVVFASMPMPHRTWPSMAHSMYEAACAEAPSLIVCSW